MYLLSTQNMGRHDKLDNKFDDEFSRRCIYCNRLFEGRDVLTIPRLSLGQL